MNDPNIPDHIEQHLDELALTPDGPDGQLYTIEALMHRLSALERAAEEAELEAQRRWDEAGEVAARIAAMLPAEAGALATGEVTVRRDGVQVVVECSRAYSFLQQGR